MQHTSLLLLSKCRDNATLAFFANGTLPEPGTVCPLDKAPFDYNSTDVFNIGSESANASSTA